MFRSVLTIRSHFIFFIAFTIGCIVSHAEYQNRYKPPRKIILITVNSQRLAIIGRDTLELEKLTSELQQRFWKSFLGTGKMQDAVKLEYNGDVPADYRTETINAIKKAQQNALIELCLQLHKKKFEELSSRQQEKIKRQYPILFQGNFE